MVVMFVPIEPAFMLAVTSDEALFMEAWQRNVLLVSPSTLLFVVRTIAHLWRQEAQTRNAQDIAKRGAELYDKLSAFVADLQKVGAKLKDAQSAYDEAEKRLSTGKGNVIRQAEMLKDLGVKSTKALPDALVDAGARRRRGPAGHRRTEAGDGAPPAPSLFDGARGRSAVGLTRRPAQAARPRGATRAPASTPPAPSRAPRPACPRPAAPARPRSAARCASRPA